ncbi:MAG: hypothetical protein Q7L55_04360 [Actinomycetota bacterium]|nr:hypothetical protein [Actinomycetota bacterium]
MSAKTPWWFSDGESESKGFDLGGKGFDLGGLASGAQQVLEWARESLITTHQGHVNPADHPQCFMCRAVLLLHPAATDPGENEDEDFTWIELDPPRD